MDDFRIYDSVLSIADLDIVRQSNIDPNNIALPVDLMGTVSLEGYTSDSLDVMVKVELSQGGSPVRTDRIALDSASQFTVENVIEGTYDIAVHVHDYLRTVLTAVDVSADPTDLGVITLKAGDANSDNSVGFQDLNLLVDNWLQSGDL